MIRTQITLGILLMIATVAAMSYTFVNEDQRMATEEEAQVARRIELGAQLFHTNCARCHGEQAEGAGICPPLNSLTLLEQRTEETGWAGSVHTYIVNTIRGGRLQSTRPELYPGEQGMAMPFWSQDFGGPLRNDQIEDIALFLENFGETELVVETGPTPTPIPQDDMEALVAAGEELYVSLGCGACHALDAVGAAGAVGPTHNGLGATAAERVTDASYTGEATSAEEYIRESIRAPSAYIVEGFQNAMPAYAEDRLPDDQLNAIVQMLLQQ